MRQLRDKRLTPQSAEEQNGHNGERNRRGRDEIGQAPAQSPIWHAPRSPHRLPDSDRIAFLLPCWYRGGAGCPAPCARALQANRRIQWPADRIGKMNRESRKRGDESAEPVLRPAIRVRAPDSPVSSAPRLQTSIDTEQNWREETGDPWRHLSMPFQESIAFAPGLRIDLARWQRRRCGRCRGSESCSPSRSAPSFRPRPSSSRCCMTRSWPGRSCAHGSITSASAC